jgi:hypothetical protein
VAKVLAFETALAFWTVTICVSSVKRAVVTAAVTEVALLTVVVRGVESQYTTEGTVFAPLTKFVPVTVRLKPVLPEASEVELSVVIVGPLTVKVLAAETAVALKFWTVTAGVAAEASWEDVTDAVSWLALT